MAAADIGPACYPAENCQPESRTIRPTVSLTIILSSHKVHCHRSYHVTRVVMASKTIETAEGGSGVNGQVFVPARKE